MSTTPTGIPIALCPTCERHHPATRQHCGDCGRPTAFLDRDSGLCLTCLNGPILDDSYAPLPGQEPLL